MIPAFIGRLGNMVVDEWRTLGIPETTTTRTTMTRPDALAWLRVLKAVKALHESPWVLMSDIRLERALQS